MAFDYGCVMIRLPELLANEVRGYAASIPRGFLKKTEDASTGIPDDLHVTIKYGILTENAEEVATALAGAAPVVVRLGRAGIFHNPTEAVLKISVESRGLRELFNQISNGLRTVTTHRDFHGHVTVAYLVKREDDPYYYRAFFSDAFEGREFVADQVVFSAASGKKHLISFGGEILPLGAGRS